MTESWGWFAAGYGAGVAVMCIAAFHADIWATLREMLSRRRRP